MCCFLHERHDGMTDDTTTTGQCMSCQSPATEDSDYCIRCLVKLDGARGEVAPPANACSASELPGRGKT